MPLKGAGVEELNIPEINNMADRFIADDEAFAKAKEARDDSKKALVELMHTHKDELVQEVKGGFSYGYDGRIFKIAPSSEKLTVKVVHDKALGDEED